MCRSGASLVLSDILTSPLWATSDNQTLIVYCQSLSWGERLALESREEQFGFLNMENWRRRRCFIPTVRGYTCKGSALVHLSLGLAEGQRCFCLCLNVRKCLSARSACVFGGWCWEMGRLNCLDFYRCLRRSHTHKHTHMQIHTWTFKESVYFTVNSFNFKVSRCWGVLMQPLMSPEQAVWSLINALKLKYKF